MSSLLSVNTSSVANYNIVPNVRLPEENILQILDARDIEASIKDY